MDLALQLRRVCVVGDNLEIGQACKDIFAAEGATLVAANSASQADIIVIIERNFSALPHEDVHAQQLTTAWSDIEDMASIYRRALPHMKQQRWGRLIYVGSLAAKEVSDQPGYESRAIALGALGMQKALSGEMGPFGVTCNSVPWSAYSMQGNTYTAGLTAIGAAVAFLECVPKCHVSNTDSTPRKHCVHHPQGADGSIR
jgi:NAD(P)-dependent dehydrogenase (short-subunit alcohol dehydrogenase family)